MHLVFNKWEPTNIPTILACFIVFPTLLSSLLLSHHTTLHALAISFAVYFTTLFGSIVAYRVSPFHPLAQYPGPILCRVSKLWMTSIVSTGRQHLYIQSLHRRYGDVVRVGELPNVRTRCADLTSVIVQDLTKYRFAMRPASCLRWARRACPRDPVRTAPHARRTETDTIIAAWAGRAFHAPIPALIGFRDPVEHARRRKPWMRAFSTAALKEYEPTIAKRATQLTEALASQKGVVDLEQWISWFTCVSCGARRQQIADTRVLQIRLHGRHGVRWYPSVGKLSR